MGRTVIPVDFSPFFGPPFAIESQVQLPGVTPIPPHFVCNLLVEDKKVVFNEAFVKVAVGGVGFLQKKNACLFSLR